MNGWRRAAVAAMSCASLACGGKLADDATTTDAGADATGDAGLGWSETGPPVTEAAPPPSSGCDYTTAETEVDSNGACSVTQTWACSGDVYALQCNCWVETCECYKNGDKMLAFGFQGNCPSCAVGPD